MTAPQRPMTRVLEGEGRGLREYQHRAIDDVRGAYRQGARSVCLQMATGSGKTHTAAQIIRSSVALENRVVFAAHLDTLIDDTSERLTKAGIVHGIVHGDRPSNPDAPVQVCSLATLHRRHAAPPTDLVILDECHRAMSTSVRGVLEAYPEAHLLGLTATPQRGDGQPLGDIFDVLVCGPTVKELTQQGHLVPCEVISPELPTDTGTIADEPDDAYRRLTPGRKAIVFCRDVDHAVHVGDRFGRGSEIVTGETSRKHRQGLRSRLESGETTVLVGCNVFLEGFDCPPLEVAILARGFGVCATFLQACGRVLRPYPGKSRAVIIDLAGTWIDHGLPQDDRIWSLDGPPKRVGDDLKLVLVRCRQCFAVMHAGPVDCPRCGASLRGCKVKRRATRVERQELQRLDDRPQHVRDEIAIKGIEKRLRASGRWTEAQIPRIARSIFSKKQRRPAA